MSFAGAAACSMMLSPDKAPPHGLRAGPGASRETAAGGRCKGRSVRVGLDRLLPPGRRGADRLFALAGLRLTACDMDGVTASSGSGRKNARPTWAELDLFLTMQTVTRSTSGFGAAKPKRSPSRPAALGGVGPARGRIASTESAVASIRPDWNLTERTAIANPPKRYGGKLSVKRGGWQGGATDGQG